MKFNLIFIIVFLNSIYFSINVVQQWNLFNSSIDLLSSASSTVNIKVFDESTSNYTVKLYKYIGKENGTVVYKKILEAYKNGIFLDKKEVDFDKIESCHQFEDDIIVCPKGKYSPVTIDFRNFRRNYDYILKQTADWELKCINYENKYFMIFYLAKDKYHLFYKKSGSEWHFDTINQEINSVKLINDRINNNEFSTLYIIKDSGSIKIKIVSHNISKDNNTNYISEFNSSMAKYIMDAGNITRVCFENNNDNFYFLTYTNTSDFSCGYFDSVGHINYTAFEENWVNISKESPLEFFDEVKIEYIEYLYDYKYAYYKINNLAKGKTFYGIIDTKKNLVVFNTDEKILTYVPYSNISMLAITSSTAYEICVIKKDGVCIDSSECTDENYILDLEGNKCGNSCDGGKIFLIRKKICNYTCDESIYETKDDQCGLCKQIDYGNPYKLINTPGCLPSIPEGVEPYNDKLNLLKYKIGYKLENKTIVINCYDTCANCSEYSEDESDQKCLTCKGNYTFKDGNCIYSENTIKNKYEYTESIIDTCSNNYITDKELNIPVKKTYDQTSSKEFKEQLFNNITSFVGSSELINGSDFIAVVLSSDDMAPKDQLKKGISAIDLGNCMSK